ncbi:unnamed protein product [marine sediment metagenome]|uniref:Uncharacterized protein n=1 Tax=marine sediment metagenome TaxID=412755 RepID=X1N2H1_9ZZZZ
MFSKTWWQREVTFSSVTATLAGTILGIVIAAWLLGLVGWG